MPGEDPRHDPRRAEVWLERAVDIELALAVDEREPREEEHERAGGRDRDRAHPVAVEPHRPQGLSDQHEHAGVVAVDHQRGGDRIGDPPASRIAPERTQQAAGGERREEGQGGVGTGLVRVEDGERADGDERGSPEPRLAPCGHPTEDERQRHEGGPEQERRKPDPDGRVAELGGERREEEVQRRRDFDAVADLADDAAEILAMDLSVGEELVAEETLVEAPGTQHEGEQRQQPDRDRCSIDPHRSRGPYADQPADRVASPRTNGPSRITPRT